MEEGTAVWSQTFFSADLKEDPAVQSQNSFFPADTRRALQFNPNFFPVDVEEDADVWSQNFFSADLKEGAAVQYPNFQFFSSGC